MRVRYGWIYREPASGATPARLRVEVRDLNFNSGDKHTKVFDDNAQGATDAANWITEQIKSDSWKLEECGFLGCRIFIES